MKVLQTPSFPSPDSVVPPMSRLVPCAAWPCCVAEDQLWHIHCLRSCLFPIQVLLLSMRDMNIAKLTSVDVPLFNAIVQDLFPNIELPVIDYGKVFAPPPFKKSIILILCLYVEARGQFTGTSLSFHQAAPRNQSVRLGCRGLCSLAPYLFFNKHLDLTCDCASENRKCDAPNFCHS